MKKIIQNKQFIIISLFIVLSIFITSFIQIESDYLWHIKAGEYMLKNGFITKDIFSWSVNGHYWMSHEWLFEVMLSFFKNLFGNFNVIIYVFMCLISIYSIIYIYNKQKIKDNLLFSLFWILLSCVFMPYVQARPHFVSFVFVTITMYFIYSLIKDENSRKIYFLPILSILWSNFHGGSSNLGYLLCFFVSIIGLFNFKCSKIEAKRLTKLQLKKLLVVGCICIPCICLNIHGVKMLTYPYSNLLDKDMINFIAEWAPTNINNPQHYPFFLICIFVLFTLLFSSKKINFIDFSLFGLGIYMGLKTVRFWPYLYLISAFFIFDYVKAFKFNNITYVVLFLNVCLMGIVFTRFNDICLNISLENVYLDNKMIDKIKEVNPKRLFNNYNCGGELIYHDVLVFIDGRADLYSSSGILRAYQAIDQVDLDYKVQLSKYDFDYYLVDVGSKIDNYIRSLDDIEKIYESNGYILYKKIKQVL